MKNNVISAFLAATTALSCSILLSQAQNQVDASEGLAFGVGEQDPVVSKSDSNQDLEVDLFGNSTLKTYSDGEPYPYFKAGEGNSANVTAGKWYRIAASQNAAKRANAQFTLMDDISGGGHSTAVFRTGISFGDEARMSVNLLSHTSYKQSTFLKVRILEASNIHSPSYLEVFVVRSGAVRYAIADNLSSGGWAPIDWTETTSIPSGYDTREYNIDMLFTVGDYQNRFSVSRGGNVNIEGALNVLGSPVVSQSSGDLRYTQRSADQNLNLGTGDLTSNNVTVNGVLTSGSLSVNESLKISGSTSLSQAGIEMPNVKAEQLLDTATFYGPVKIGPNQYRVDYVFKRDSTTTEKGDTFLRLPLGRVSGASHAQVIASTVAGGNYESAEWSLAASRHGSVKCLEHKRYGDARNFTLEGTMFHGWMWLSLDYDDAEYPTRSSTTEINVSVTYTVANLNSQYQQDLPYPETLSDQYGNEMRPVEIFESISVVKHGGWQSGYGRVANAEKVIRGNLLIEGDNTTIDNDTTINGNLTAESITIQPAGDIGMGVFGAE